MALIPIRGFVHRQIREVVHDFEAVGAGGVFVFVYRELSLFVNFSKNVAFMFEIYDERTKRGKGGGSPSALYSSRRMA